MKQLLTTLLIAILVFGCKENDGRRYFLISYAIMQDGAERIGTINSRGPTLEPKEYYQNVIYNTVKCDGVSKYEIIINDVHEFKDSSEWNTWLPENSRRMPDTCPPPIRFSIEKNIGPSVMVTDSGIYMDDYTISPDPSPTPDTLKPLNIKPQPRNRIDIDSIRFGDGITKNTILTTDSASLIAINTDWYITPATPNKSNDTSRCLLLVSDTSSINGFRSSRCWWMEGYVVHLSFSGGSDILTVDKSGNIIWPEPIYLDQSKIPMKKNIIVWLSKEIK